ncbi:Y-family DNA polymerase [Thiomicrorhabdus sp. 6S3-12]|uniref:Y-family DNA polymerase n=1 Tax=Thiomicrorhabdus sp. 6S3-12 TaxID=2819681 RepID=UPI001AADF8AC|nr:Y-family DNA polymerase [Thiomicrorhabdus sp. 6S3-12]MBO1923027.1 Y-family DNA polymerase [Thiomicrorhabdus sp. 6S3-12]
MGRIFALIDGNAFYASCQMAFEPALQGRPVVVLSNNDGCIVAANAEAKNLNSELLAKVKSLGDGGYYAARPDNMMFQPYFKVKWLLDKHRAKVFSSNYELYADMSNRMHQLLGRFAPRQEVYSIDESFLEFTAVHPSLYPQGLAAYGEQIRVAVRQDLGLPVAVGFGSTKTLAKLANHLAKKLPQYQGVCDLTALPTEALSRLLKQVDVGQVWGVGRRLNQALRRDGIITVEDLRQADRARLRVRYGVVLERTAAELNGISCLQLEQVRGKKQIVVSRSFSQKVSDFERLAEALIVYSSRAAEKLRRQNSVCQIVTVFIRTDPYAPETYYAPSHATSLIYPSDNSVLFAKIVRRALRQIWRPGFRFHKAGVVLSELQPKTQLQLDLFAAQPKFSANPRQDKLMTVMDQLNRKHGRGSLFLASSGSSRPQGWQMARNLLSPRYTTRWEDIPIAKAK